MPDEGASQLPASSYHPGGANVTMCDGTVRFVSETIDAGNLVMTSTEIRTKTGIASGEITGVYTGPSIWGVWGNLGTPGGGENDAIP
jgi:prepilin-type processing-associated H-X9-DG protein